MRNRKYVKKWHKVTNILFLWMIIINFITICSFSKKLVEKSENNQTEDSSNTTVYEETITSTEFTEECENTYHDTVSTSANILPSEEIESSESEIEETEFSREINDHDKYLLAKIAMAEAEGESLHTKILVIMTVLNRVESRDFPNTVEEVIFQNDGKTYQFTPIIDGRWYKVEPNEECWKAVEIVNMTEEDVSNGALFFESCKGDSWHSRNLEFICQSDNTKFYK